MRTILASFGSLEGFRCCVAGVERACESLEERIPLWPVASMEEVKKAVAVRNPSIFALDPLARGTLGPKDSSLFLEAVEALGRQLSALPLLLLDLDGIVDSELRAGIQDLGIQLHVVGAEASGVTTCAVRIVALLRESPEDESAASPTGAAARVPPECEPLVTEDRARFGDLYRTYGEVCRMAALRRGASAEDAEDAVHNVFLRELKRSAQVRERKYTKRYFDRAGWNEADHILSKRERGRRLGKLYQKEEKAEGETRSSPERRRDRTDTEEVRAAVDALPEPQRAVARLCMIEEWSNQRVATLLGVPVKRIKRYRRQAREVLKSVLQDLRSQGTS